MKKQNIFFHISAFLFGVVVALLIINAKTHNIIKQQEKTISALKASNYKVEEYKQALKLADIIFDNNDIWDKDGSDVMSDYLNLRANMDTTFYKGFHNNVLLDNLSYDYNE